jgi:5-methylcytosine-specific restriction endonuclease McrA
MARRRTENPEAARFYQKEHYYKNHEKRKKKMRDYYARRFFWSRSMKLRGERRATAINLFMLWKNQKGLCAMTGRTLSTNAQLDHIIPKAKGGCDSVENLRWVCPDFNYAKRDMSDAEMLSLCSDVMRWIGEQIKSYEQTKAQGTQ